MNENTATFLPSSHLCFTFSKKNHQHILHPPPRNYLDENKTFAIHFSVAFETFNVVYVRKKRRIPCKILVLGKSPFYSKIPFHIAHFSHFTITSSSFFLRFPLFIALACCCLLLFVYFPLFGLLLCIAFICCSFCPFSRYKLK